MPVLMDIPRVRNFCLESFIDAHLLNPGDDFADLPETFVIFITEKDVIGKGKLMHDFFCIDPDDMNYKELADKVRYFKEDEKGVAAMCKVMEDMRNDTARQTTVNHIRDIMTNLKLTVEQAMDALNIPESQRNTYIGLIGKKNV